VAVQMRPTDAYAYESAKYLADARACDKLSLVSPGDVARKPKPESAAEWCGRSSALVP